jgi:hypothetical protein
MKKRTFLYTLGQRRLTAYGAFYGRFAFAVDKLFDEGRDFFPRYSKTGPKNAVRRQAAVTLHHHRHRLPRLADRALELFPL